MTRRDPWTRDVAALETAAHEVIRQIGFLRRQMHTPEDRIRALIIQTEVERAHSIASRMERRYERESAARDAALSAQREGADG